MHTIARAVPQDAPTMLAIQRRAFAREAGLSQNWEIPPLTESVDAVVDHVRHQTAFTARLGPHIVGAVRGIVADGVCTIRALCLEPQAQGRGIGSALLIRMRVKPPRSRGGRKAPCVHLGAHTNELGLTHERSDL